MVGDARPGGERIRNLHTLSRVTRNLTVRLGNRTPILTAFKGPDHGLMWLNGSQPYSARSLSRRTRAALCTAVTDRSDGSAMADQLLGDGRGHFRWHCQVDRPERSHMSVAGVVQRSGQCDPSSGRFTPPGRRPAGRQDGELTRVACRAEAHDGEVSLESMKPAADGLLRS